MRATARSALIGAVLLGLGAAACGAPTPKVSPAGPTGTTSTTGATLGLAVESSAYGAILATSSGMTLYEHSSDTAAKSGCTGSCAAVWTPFTVNAVPGFGPGVKRASVNEVGSTAQLSYGGHPLYTYFGDKASDQTTGEGVMSFGGTWYVLSASTGRPVTAKVPGSSAATLPGGV